MKKYRFEFDKFVKDLERRSSQHRQRILEDAHDQDDQNEQEIKRDRLKRYHEHQHNSIVYKKQEKK